MSRRKRLEYEREYRERNKERLREYHKQYRLKNKERLYRYNLEYVRAKRWLNGSDNYSGELG